jgi:hypothetical protein
MKYDALTEDQRNSIRTQRQTQLEAEHFNAAQLLEEAKADPTLDEEPKKAEVERLETVLKSTEAKLALYKD